MVHSATANSALAYCAGEVISDLVIDCRRYPAPASSSVRLSEERLGALGKRILGPLFVGGIRADELHPVVGLGRGAGKSPLQY